MNRTSDREPFGAISRQVVLRDAVLQHRVALAYRNCIAEGEVARRDFIAERLPDLRDAEWRPFATLSGCRPQIGLREA